MLQPKKTKYRKQQKGRIKGLAHRGHELAFGAFGEDPLQLLERVPAASVVRANLVSRVILIFRVNHL